MAWPRASGHDVHTFYLMQALARLGHEVALATLTEPHADAIADAGLSQHYCFAANTISPRSEMRLTGWEEKFREYWGVDAAAVRWVGECAGEFDADAVVVSGLRVLPYLGAIPASTQAVWYAADEWVRHHLSQVNFVNPRTWGELRQALHKGLYERAYRRRLDRVWVVSEADARAFRRWAGIRAIDVLPNGVDAEHYAPGPESPAPDSCVFWGRLDFGPNIQALEWFLRRVWPRVRKSCPAARFDVFGFQPTPEVITLCRADGVSLTADRPDIRGEIRRRSVVVLPFVSGGGIKNKLLEAAAMAKPIVATPRTVEGLSGEPPMAVAKSARAFAAEVTALFTNEAQRARLGAAARAWVIEHHSWAAAARIAAAGLAGQRVPNPEAVA